MKTIRMIIGVVLCLLIVVAGCQTAPPPPGGSDEAKGSLDLSSFYTHFAPTKIDVLPLTELVPAGDNQRSHLNLYVSLLDAFGSQIKSPGVFRIELYDYVQRTTDRKGKRTGIWPDIDLTDPAENDRYWNDFLRTYQFDLPLEYTSGQDFILQVTCLCPNGSRLTSNFTLRSPK